MKREIKIFYFISTQIFVKNDKDMSKKFVCVPKVRFSLVRGKYLIIIIV
jgi:hypothetical protein